MDVERLKDVEWDDHKRIIFLDFQRHYVEYYPLSIRFGLSVCETNPFENKLMSSVTIGLAVFLLPHVLAASSSSWQRLPSPF
jgi:hypothetical protein